MKPLRIVFSLWGVYIAFASCKGQPVPMEAKYHVCTHCETIKDFMAFEDSIGSTLLSVNYDRKSNNYAAGVEYCYKRKGYDNGLSYYSKLKSFYHDSTFFEAHLLIMDSTEVHKCEDFASRYDLPDTVLTKDSLMIWNKYEEIKYLYEQYYGFSFECSDEIGLPGRQPYRCRYMGFFNSSKNTNRKLGLLLTTSNGKDGYNLQIEIMLANHYFYNQKYE